MELTFLERAALTSHPVAQRLFRIMETKQSNLAIALDVTSQAELVRLADQLGPYMSLLKTHVDILEDFTPDLGEKLRALAERHQFLIFEDRKFADIGQTVSLQYERGIYRIIEWADLINAHIVPGPGVIEGLKARGLSRGRGLLLLAEMSSHGTLAAGSYTQRAVEMAREHADFVVGWISLGKIAAEPSWLHLTPGVQLVPGQDAWGQRYRTVEEVVTQNGTDLCIVGRAITHAADPLQQACLYRNRAWAAYQQRLA